MPPASGLDEADPPRIGGGLAWSVTVALGGIAFLGAAWLLARPEPGPVPPFLTGGVEPRATTDPRAVEVLELAGSGSNLPITEALVDAYATTSPRRPYVHRSIGSRGGIRALLDGVVDVALVSRPLAPTERELGLVETPYARVPVIVAVHAGIPDHALTSAELVEIFAGQRVAWSDGTPIVVLQRERGDSSHRAVGRRLPRFDEVNDAAWRAHRFRVLDHDDAMLSALSDTRGAIGLLGQGAIPRGLPIRALVIDGAAPTVERVRDGSYPFSKDLAFVSDGPPEGELAQLVDFSRGPAGRVVITRMGALPLEEGGP